MPTQLRIYTINRGSLEVFAAEWREKVYPLRTRHGFQIEGAWMICPSNQFVWLMSYDGPEPWQEKEQWYYASPERQGMQPDPARLIARSEQYFVRRVL